MVLVYKDGGFKTHMCVCFPYENHLLVNHAAFICENNHPTTQITHLEKSHINFTQCTWSHALFSLTFCKHLTKISKHVGFFFNRGPVASAQVTTQPSCRITV